MVPGWWLGLSLMHTLFTLEHNAICDRLQREYPTWSDEELFQRARLVIAALIAKIHTVEWTPAVISHPTTVVALRANWFGVAGERLRKAFGRLSDSEVISGIPGSATDHYGVPYALTEEFTSVYRMHPLIPDDYSFRSAADGHELEQRTLPELSGPNSQPVLERIGMRDLLYSFGTEHPGAIVPAITTRASSRTSFVRTGSGRTSRRPTSCGSASSACRATTSSAGCCTSAGVRRRRTDRVAGAQRSRALYGGDIERVDLMVGMFAEKRPEGFAFSDTAFRIFILMASRRINSDRFLTDDYSASTYTQTGIDWVENTRFVDVLQRHYPDLAPSLRELANGFKPWSPVGAAGADA